MKRPPFQKSLRFILALIVLGAGLAMLPFSPAQSQEAIKDYPELDYINITQALLRLGRFKPDNDDYLDAYAMAVHCDVVSGSYRDEFRWKQAREAMRNYIKKKKETLSLRVAVRSKILFTRYDFDSKYFLFSPETAMNRVNTFNTNPRPASPGCTGEASKLLPSVYSVVTNNPVNLPGLHLSEEQARDLSQKFASQGNTQRRAWIRFLIDITDSDFIGPSMFSNRGTGDQKARVKGTLYAIEFFSDPYYRNRFFVYYPY
jgi:hypothetical protein